MAVSRDKPSQEEMAEYFGKKYDLTTMEYILAKMRIRKEQNDEDMASKAAEGKGNSEEPADLENQSFAFDSMIDNAALNMMMMGRAPKESTSKKLMAASAAKQALLSSSTESPSPFSGRAPAAPRADPRSRSIDFQGYVPDKPPTRVGLPKALPKLSPKFAGMGQLMRP